MTSNRKEKPVDFYEMQRKYAQLLLIQFEDLDKRLQELLTEQKQIQDRNKEKVSPLLQNKIKILLKALRAISIESQYLMNQLKKILTSAANAEAKLLITKIEKGDHYQINARVKKISQILAMNTEFKNYESYFRDSSNIGNNLDAAIHDNKNKGFFQLDKDDPFKDKFIQRGLRTPASQELVNILTSRNTTLIEEIALDKNSPAVLAENRNWVGELAIILLKVSAAILLLAVTFGYGAIFFMNLTPNDFKSKTASTKTLDRVVQNRKQFKNEAKILIKTSNENATLFKKQKKSDTQKDKENILQINPLTKTRIHKHKRSATR